jgi:DNA modification methylase
MNNVELFNNTIEDRSKRLGPPNRMNDLNYTTWMKFQKSFFRYSSIQNLVEECIFFFTKATWPNGESSRSLVITDNEFNASVIPPPRIVSTEDSGNSISRFITKLEKISKLNNAFDFLFIDLRRYIKTPDQYSHFIKNYSDRFFTAFHSMLIADRYGCVLVDTEGPGGKGFPYPWAIALNARAYVKLRDEKIALIEEKERVFYCLFFQAANDLCHSVQLTPTLMQTAKTKRIIPAWTIPKPPPRKKNEVLHPAKYPETLVSQFIELFTKPGDNVFDPMVGTGSTVVAAVRSGRNGYGIDLISDFVEIAKRRVQIESQDILFEKFIPKPRGFIFQGDATHLNEINELQEATFQYAITSPPYWSMLTNPGSENQEARRGKNLILAYSDNEKDLGNVQDYEHFLDLLEVVYSQVAKILIPGGHLTVVVKNVKRNHVIYPLAWDVTARLCSPVGAYALLGTTLWCQDDVGLKPFAVGIHWVSNTLHHYCMHFQKRKD